LRSDADASHLSNKIDQKLSGIGGGIKIRSGSELYNKAGEIKDVTIVQKPQAPA
jgi:hypothetical protein